MRLIAAAALLLAASCGSKSYSCDVDGFYVVPAGDRSDGAMEALRRNVELSARRSSHAMGALPNASRESLERAAGCTAAAVPRQRDPELERSVRNSADELEALADNLSAGR